MNRQLRDTWARAFADGREAALTGGGPERLENACARLSLAGSGTYSCFVEAPLLGPADYDALVLHNPRYLVPGCRVADSGQRLAQTVLDWAAGLGRDCPYIHFELDAGAETLSGIHCKLEGRLAAAEGFFAAVGEPWRMKTFEEAVRRLPEGWFCRYTGVFPGRTTGSTRMEVEPDSDASRQAVSDPACLKQCLDRIGFAAYDDTMLRDAARLLAVDTPVSIQFDILPDGSLLPGCSVLSLYENVRPDCAPLFLPDGAATRTCGIYEEMGVADGRWRMIEPSLFTERSAWRVQGRIEGWIGRCLPCCTKAKWIGGRRAPAKVYFLLEAIRTVPDLTQFRKEDYEQQHES